MTVTIGSVLLGLALLLIVGLFLARPIILAARPQTQRPLTPREQLRQRKEALLEEIRTVDFDHETGKLPDDVYEQQRAYLVAETAAVLQQLDALETAAPAATATSDADPVYSEIEAAVARLRQRPAVAPTATATRAAPQAANGQTVYCTSCGKPLDPGDKFCAYCGQPVRAVQPA